MEGGHLWFTEQVTYRIECGPKSTNFTKNHPIMEFLGNDINETVKQNRI
jgi:hypothetical protein